MRLQYHEASTDPVLDSSFSTIPEAARPGLGWAPGEDWAEDHLNLEGICQAIDQSVSEVLTNSS